MAESLAKKLSKGNSSERAQKRPAEHARQPAVSAGPYGEVLALQRSAGNRAVSQLLESGMSASPFSGAVLQRQCASCANSGSECAECRKKRTFALQPKLTINEPGDRYEQEADRIADQVLPAPAHDGTPSRIQRFVGQPTQQTETAPASVDRALASPGSPLEPALRQDMEQRFGHDFSGVRVHSGAVSEQSAREVSAHAYTVGHDMVFGAGRFAPGTHEGRRLIAHELTHVVQQSAADAIRVGQSNEKRGLSPISVGFPTISRTGAQPAIQRGFGELRVAEAKEEKRKERRREHTIRFFRKVKDHQLKEAYISRLQRYLDEGLEENEYWDLETIEQIVKERAPNAPWYEEARRNFFAQLAQLQRQKLLQTLPWYQRHQLEALDVDTKGWTKEERDLARDLLWQWFELRNQGHAPSEVKEHILRLVKEHYEQWLKAVDQQRLDRCKKHELSTVQKIQARAGGEEPCVSWFADQNKPGPLRLLDIERYMRVAAGKDDIVPMDAVFMWVREYRRRTNKELLEQEEYIQKATAIPSLGMSLGLGRPPVFGMQPPTPARTVPTAPPPATSKVTPPPAPSPPPAKSVVPEPLAKSRQPPKAEGRQSEIEEPKSTAKRSQPPKAEVKQEAQKTLLSGKEYRRIPGRKPDIGVLEVKADNSVSIVSANREDVRDLTGSNTHIALANAPEGLGPITAGANRYRFYLNKNGVVTRLGPLDRATQTPGHVDAIKQALRRNRLVSPEGTMIDLSLGKPNKTLQVIVFR
jgi:hypothetical protein